ncbi:hypothetical protein MPC4_10279 [Methylocella tundrae]|uniref:Uncharacterized protein n=1 Tax=Methylocella tundrae TaxID=227605 RepID=A0A8B6M1I8_METTU|nr:hypothetical protein MPC1_2440003 [Methylocella tundrae]VTZ48329.1 hypothetical protein MPC4_10279 [Methylocella tundrae]
MIDRSALTIAPHTDVEPDHDANRYFEVPERGRGAIAPLGTKPKIATLPPAGNRAAVHAQLVRRHHGLRRAGAGA